jgi:hypothetical protein
VRRTFVLLGVVAALVGLSALPAAATLVINDNGKAQVIDASWWSDTESGWTYGYASAWDYGRDAYLDFFEESGSWVWCDAGTPGDPTDDYEGFVGTYTYGSGPATVHLARGYATGHADAVVDVWVDSYNDCTGEYGYEEHPSVAVSIDLTATSPLVREKGSSSFHIPSEFNDNYRFSSAYRQGDGVVTVGEVGHAAYYGMLGQTTWHYHSNSK